jgi:hypothetical protein
MTVVACFTAMTAAVPAVTITPTFSRTNSAAISARRSLRPPPQRYSIATVRPSTQPCSSMRCTNAAVHSLCANGGSKPRNPMAGGFAGCVRAAKRPRHAAAHPHRVVDSREASLQGELVHVPSIDLRDCHLSVSEGAFRVHRCMPRIQRDRVPIIPAASLPSLQGTAPCWFGVYAAT